MDIKDNPAAGFAALFYHAANLSKYSKEEYDAIYQGKPMTQKIFDKCIETAFSIFDFENIKYLTEKYPEFAENCLRLKNK
ncbi:MAG: hypothetical protein IJO22_09000 [Oscillospiraceae bacterium]|nr:hypothetical protein [Oscillospiraceae bacterium]